ncbi:MAG: acyl carrier protein [Flavobacterium sp.]|nr:acyl carrier protein [Flavobacterium sp.]
MERNEIIAQVKQILKTALNHENFEMSETLSATDVDGWDSLSHMIIISKVEKQFSITFKLKELNKMKNMGDMLDLIASKL